MLRRVEAIVIAEFAQLLAQRPEGWLEAAVQERCSATYLLHMGATVNDLWLAGLKNGCASGLATICCKTALQPFDTLKTLQQMSTARINLIETSSRLVRDHGILALYRGLGVSLVGAVPAM